MNNNGNLTEGNVVKTLVRFALPFLAASALQTLYGIVDLLVVGQFADAPAMSAVSIGSLVFAFITSAAIGLTTGGTVLIGQYLGMGSREEAKKSAATMFSLYMLIAVALTVMFLLLTDPILRLLNTPDEAYTQARSYVFICTFGLIFTVGYNSVSAVLRAEGDSRHPLYFVIVACIFNIVGDLVFVGVFHLGAAGAALATTLGQALSFITGAVYMRRSNGLFDFSPKSFRLHKGKSSQLLGIGVPIALQESLVMVSFLILEAVINDMGVIASAAAGVTDKLFMIGVIPSSAFSAAIAAMVAQNMGAQKPERAKQSLFFGAACSFIFAAAAFVWLKFAPSSAIRLFTADESVLQQAVEYLHFYAYEYLLCSIIFPINGLINGSGHTKFTLINNITSTFAVRVPLCLLFYNLIPGATLRHVGLALPLASAVQLLAAAVYYFSGKWKTAVLEKSE